MILISTTCRSRMLGPDFGSNHGSFSDVAGVSFRIEKSAPLRIMRSAPKQNVKGQTRFPCLRQNSFPFAPMKTEQKTSSGNRAQAPLPEPFYSQKQSLGTRKKPCGSNLGSIPGTLFGSSTDLIVGTHIGTSFDVHGATSYSLKIP